MLPQKLRLGLAIFLIAVITGYHLPLVQADPQPSTCQTILEKPSSGQEAITLLGSNLSVAAEQNSLTSYQLTQLLLNNPTFHLDMCGKGFYAESMIVPQMSPLPIENFYLPGSLTTKSTLKTNTVNTIYSSVFKLHSNPGSKKTIYLDFDGEKIENTAWNKNFNNDASWIASGFSQDTDFTTFSNSELDVIQSVWQRVAEDFSSFDVDVTTQLPALGALERTNAADDIYGTRALISNDTVIFNACKCSGLAYVGVFDSIGNLHDINQPAWIFTQGLGDNPKFIAEAITHEVGHTLGLSHDGSKAVLYFPGINGWAPIMGVGFYQPVTQWSKGEYVDATNVEDDLSIIASHGLLIRKDEDDNSEKTARIIKENQGLGGVITTAEDVDYFSFTPNASTEFTFAASAATLSPDLDINLTIYPVGKASAKTVFNPPLVITSTDIVEGLSVNAPIKLIAGATYIITIDGSPLSTSSTAYTAYGSIGTYKISVNKGRAVAASNTSAGPIDAGTTSLPDKLVLPVQTPKNTAPLELPDTVKIQRRIGSKFLSVI
jgi:hypothetical protein